MQFNIRNLFHLGILVAGVGVSSLGTVPAHAQFTIETTGRVSGTIQLPSFNPNYNDQITRIDTDSNGTFFRNIGTQSNPNLVPVYTSNYVKVATRADGSLRHFVDFKGIPVVSFDASITSPVFVSGELDTYTYQGKIPNVKMQAVVQDELALGRAFFQGIVTDPKTGNQYQGRFELRGQGPRYSDRNGGESPTVFDFRSDQPGKPTVTSYNMQNVPLVRLRVTVPADAQLVPANPGGGTTNPGGGGTTNPGGGGTTNPGGGGTTNPGGGGTTNPGGNISNPGGVVTNPGVINPGGGTTNPGTTNPDNGITNPPSSGIETNIETNKDYIGAVEAIASNPDGTIQEVEFSDGKTYQLTPEIAQACAQSQVPCQVRQPQAQRKIGPRSRVLLK